MHIRTKYLLCSLSVPLSFVVCALAVLFIHSDVFLCGYPVALLSVMCWRLSLACPKCGSRLVRFNGWLNHEDVHAIAGFTCPRRCPRCDCDLTARSKGTDTEAQLLPKP
jgi:hypothetical protein